MFRKDLQYYKFCLYGFLKNLRFFEAFLLIFLLDHGLDFFQIGILYAISEITINLFEVPSGMIADAIGRKRTLILAFIFYIVSFIVFYLSTTYSLFILAMILFALGEAFRSGNNKAMIMDYLSVKGWSNDKVNYYGHTRSWSQMGSALSALVGGVIVFVTGHFRYIFLFSILPYLLDLALVMSYPRFLDKHSGKKDIGMLAAQFKRIAADFWVAIRSVVLLKAIANLSFYSGYYKAVKDYLQPVVRTFALSLPIFLYLEDEKRASLIIGIIFSLLFLATSYASRKSGHFSERFRNLAIPLNITLIAGLSMGFFSGLFFWVDLYILSIILFFGIYIIENLRKPIGIAYITNVSDHKVLASTLSTESQAKSLSAAILAPIIGIFADLYGVGVALMIVSAGMILLMPFYGPRTRKKQ